jgi:hypothetical protein
MTVATETVLPVSYDLDGSTRAYTISFRILSASDIIVLIADGEDEDELELGADYSVAFEDGDEEFELTLATASGTSGKRLIVSRDMEIIQPTDFDDGTAFPAESMETALDRETMLIQQLQEGLGRAIQLPRSTETRDIAMPFPDADKYIGWNAAGTALENKTLITDDVEAPDSTSTTNYPGDIGLETSSSNNSTLLNAFMAELSADGGGHIMLQAPNGDGGTYHFEDTLVVPSFVSLSCQSPTTLGNGASVKIAGDKRAYATGLTLVLAVSAGGVTIRVDTTGAGGGAVSSYLTVGKPLRIRDNFDDSGNARTSESNVVSAINDTTRDVTLVDTLDNDYALATTQITADDAIRLGANTTALSNLVTINASDLARANLYDWVLLEDNRQTDGVTTYQEIAQIVGIEVDGSNIITLSRKVRRVYTTAQKARLTILDPAIRAQVTGFAPERVDDPDGDFVPTFEMRYAVDCAMVDCSEPNSAAYGTDGASHRIHKCYNCWYVRPNARNAKHVAEGEGNGVQVIYSTRSGAIMPTMSAMRHAAQMSASTECAILDLDSTDGLLADIDFHGLNSVGCIISFRQVTFSNRTASASNGAIVCGNATHIDGDHDCVVAGVNGGVLGPFDGASAYGIRMYPPSTNFTVLGVNAKDIRVFLLHQDISGSDLVSDGLRILNCSVDGCSDRLFDCRGGANGSSVKTLTNLTVRNLDAERLVKGMRFDQIGNVVLDDVDMTFSAPDASDSYAIFLDDVTSFEYHDGKIKGNDRGAWLANVTHYFNNVGFIGQVHTTIRNDQGSADGTWRMCWSRGFTPAYGTTGGSTITDEAAGNIGTLPGAGAIGDNTLTLAKLVTTSQNHLMARSASGTGNWEDITVGGAAIAALQATTTPAALLAHVGGAPLDSPPLINVPTAPTAAALTNTTQLATTAFVEAVRVALIAGAPAGLDTLDELAAALGDDASFASTMTTALSGKQPLHAALTAYAALTTAANKAVYYSGANTPVTFDIASLARTFLGIATVNLQKVALNTGTVALVDGANIATDCSTGQIFTVTLGGNRTLTNPTNVVDGASYCWRITQDGTGSRTLALGANFKFATGDAWAASTAAAAVDYIFAQGRPSSLLDIVGIRKGFA